jgi:carbon storage regulator CsrA
MLVLSRRPDQQIVIGQDIKVTILRVQGRSVKIGVEAPGNIAVLRSELLGKPSPRRPGVSGIAGETADEESDASEGPSPKADRFCLSLAP